MVFKTFQMEINGEVVAVNIFYYSLASISHLLKFSEVWEVRGHGFDRGLGLEKCF